MLDGSGAVLHIAAFARHARIGRYAHALVLLLARECAALVRMAIAPVDDITNGMHLVACGVVIDVHRHAVRMHRLHEVELKLVGRRVRGGNVQRLCHRHRQRARLAQVVRMQVIRERREHALRPCAGRDHGLGARVRCVRWQRAGVAVVRRRDRFHAQTVAVTGKFGRHIFDGTLLLVEFGAVAWIQRFRHRRGHIHRWRPFRREK